MYTYRAQGAYIRSRQKWIEEGECNTAYFFRLEKSRLRTSLIETLNIDGTVTNNPQEIASFCANFYSNLYHLNFSEEATCTFLESVKNCKTISRDDSNLCDSEITLLEVNNSIIELKNNKSPGTDGLTAEFYKQFSEELSPFLLKVFEESIQNETLPPTLTQGLITLIPKPKKDLLLIDNWHPVSLLNNDYNILAIIFAKKLKSVLNSVIDETQSGFMNKRHIVNNIRLVLD